MTSATILLIALLLDAGLGEPRMLWSRLPHPTVLMGRAIAWGEKRLNQGRARLAKGALLLLALVTLAALLGSLLSSLGGVVEAAIAFTLLAHRSLADHVANVARDLRVSLGDGRRAVSRIVSRDSAVMDEAGVSRAAIESAAENFSDGVIAPAFWLLVAGLPGILVYKVVNTADSMIGYRSARYEAFGKAAARLDDLLNWIPARITALLIAAVDGRLRDWRAISADARLHRSPNAGWPEAAMARALDVALAGPRIYDGRLRDLAWVNPPGRRDVGPAEIDAACAMLWKSWRALVACVALGALIGSILS